MHVFNPSYWFSWERENPFLVLSCRCDLVFLKCASIQVSAASAVRLGSHPISIVIRNFGRILSGGWYIHSLIGVWLLPFQRLCFSVFREGDGRVPFVYEFRLQREAVNSEVTRCWNKSDYLHFCGSPTIIEFLSWNLAANGTNRGSTRWCWTSSLMLWVSVDSPPFSVHRQSCLSRLLVAF